VGVVNSIDFIGKTIEISLHTEHLTSDRTSEELLLRLLMIENVQLAIYLGEYPFTA